MNVAHHTRLRFAARSIWLATAAVAVLVCGSARGQAPGVGRAVSIGAKPAILKCGTGCSLRVEPIVQLAPPSDYLPFTDMTFVALDPRGGFLAGPTLDGAHFIRFDRYGKSQGVFGRRGQGPGEYALIAGLAVGPTGRTFLFDLRLRRLTIIDTTGSLGVFPIASMAVNTGFLPLSGGLLLVNASVGTPDRSRYSMHVVDDSGRFVRSFDDDNQNDTPSSLAVARLITPASEGGVWVGHRDRPRFGRWSEDGKRLGDFVFPWHIFAGDESLQRDANGNRSIETRIDGLVEDPSGLLLVLFERPKGTRARVNPGKPSERRGAELAPPSPSEKTDLSESWLVIVDPKRGTVIGRTQLPGMFTAVLPGGVFVRIVEDSSGGVQFYLVHVMMESRRSRTNIP